MRNLISIFLIIFITTGVTLNDAHAKRFGGGRNFGVQRSVGQYSRTVHPTSKANPRTNKWAGPLAGLVLGGLLASLFMGHGVLSGLLSWLLVGGAILLIVGWLRNRNHLHRNISSYQSHNPRSNFDNLRTTSSGSISANSNINEEVFVRNAKVLFMRLQAAYDAKNLSDIREFTSPEMYAEIQMQIQEMQGAPNVTEVTSLEARLVDVSDEGGSQIASVEFTGNVREEVGGNIVHFNETWHFKQNEVTQKWVIVGLQQN